MKGFSKLTLNKVLKHHKQNPQDKKIHEMIEKGEIERSEFNKLIEKAANQKPFDKKPRKSVKNG